MFSANPTLPDPSGSSSFYSWLPFEIEKVNGIYRPRNFDIQAYAGISVSTTYYVDASGGLDTNSGADWANAFKTLTKAFTMPDVDRIYATGRFIAGEQVIAAGFARDVELIGVGTCLITSDVTAAGIGAWGAVDNHYEADITEYAGTVWDESNLDAYGLATILTKKTSIAEVDATQNSYWTDWTNRKVYVRTFDDRAPDGDIVCYDSLAFYWLKDNIDLYLENVEIFPNSSYRNAGAGGTRVFAKECTFRSVTIWGVGLSILDTCTFRRGAGDAINYDPLNGVTSLAVEIECDATHFGTGGTDQASTTHAGVTAIVRIGGNYHDVSGQVIADTGGTVSWCLGVIMDTSTVTDVGYNHAAYAWLDGCTITGCATDLQETGAGAIYYRDLTSGGNFSGTCTPY